jgi:hypothetical protein
MVIDENSCTCPVAPGTTPLRMDKLTVRGEGAAVDPVPLRGSREPQPDHGSSLVAGALPGLFEVEWQDSEKEALNLSSNI